MNWTTELFAAFNSRDVARLRRAVIPSLELNRMHGILHPLGFYEFRLAESEKVTVRLHYWPDGEREVGTAITPYHDHVWALLSCILAGQIENVMLDLVIDESGQYQLAYINQNAKTDSVVPASSRVTLRERSRDVHPTGIFYEIPPREFHYTDVKPGQSAITIVRATVMVEGGPRTLLPIGADGHAPSRVPLADPAPVIAEISKLIESSEDS